MSSVPIFLTICWGIWKFRNFWLFEDTSSTILEVVDYYLEYITSFNTIQAYTLIVKKENVLLWQPPSHDKVKVNFNGVLFKNKATVGIGIILKDGARNVLFVLSRKEVRLFEMGEIESLVALKSLQRILGMDFCSLIIEVDSWNVVEVIKFGNASF